MLTRSNVRPDEFEMDDATLGRARRKQGKDEFHLARAWIDRDSAPVENNVMVSREVVLIEYAGLFSAFVEMLTFTFTLDVEGTTSTCTVL